MTNDKMSKVSDTEQDAYAMAAADAKDAMSAYIKATVTEAAAKDAFETAEAAHLRADEEITAACNKFDDAKTAVWDAAHAKDEAKEARAKAIAAEEVASEVADAAETVYDEAAYATEVAEAKAKATAARAAAEAAANAAEDAAKAVGAVEAAHLKTQQWYNES